LDAVNKVHLVTGIQLERLLFTELSSRSQPVVRGRVLKDLVDRRVLTTARRRIGGGRRGSDPLVYALDSAGQWLMQIRTSREQGMVNIRRRAIPGERFIEHMLAVSELYVRLVELERAHDFMLGTFFTEPDCWWPNGLGGRLKPDAFVMLTRNGVTDYWWCEADMATESLPTIRRKLMVYLDFLRRGQLGPGNIMPRVLVATLTDPRRRTVQAEVTRLPEPASRLFIVTTLADASGVLAREVHLG
jgi:hypothetical protein